METGSKNPLSFHLAGVIPVAGQKLDFNLPWHDCMQPLAPGYLAIHHAIMQCAWAGCETIWIVCHKEMQPLLRYEVGEYVLDPVWLGRGNFDKFPSQTRKRIPIYYVPIHPKDRDKRDCLSWSVLYGAQTAYWISKQMSKWVVPDMYYASFPYGVYPLEILRQHRKQISSSKRFILSYENQTVQQGHYLGFTFDGEDFKRFRRDLRKNATGVHVPGKGMTREKLPVEKRWSARFFPLDKVFKSVILEEAKVIELPWYHKIDNWNSYCDFLASPERTAINKPYKKILSYKEFNGVGIDEE